MSDDADAERRALIEDLAKLMHDEWPGAIAFPGFGGLAAAVVEYLEKHGLLKPGD